MLGFLSATLGTAPGYTVRAHDTRVFDTIFSMHAVKAHVPLRAWAQLAA